MAAKATKPVYDESKIKTLSSLEHIRLRTGMYIGRKGTGAQYEDGIYVLVKEVVDNAIDEFIMGHGSKVDITIQDNLVTVRDFGRGIPLGKVVDCVSRINTGAKYNDDVFQFSVGLNGVGTKAVNALSCNFLVRSHREGKSVEATFEKGVITGETKPRMPDEKNGTYVEFVPDPEIFGEYNFREEHLEQRMQLYAYLNAGLQIIYNGETFSSKDGLVDFVLKETHFERLYQPLSHREKTLEIAFTHTNQFSETYYSFVNGQYTTDGGTHLSAFREGLLKGVNEFAKKRFEGADVREGIFGTISVRIKEPVFESQTKNKLGNSELRGELVTQVRDVVVDLLHKNPKVAEKLITKIEETQKIRKELQSVKKMARERAKSVSIRIPQLKDCKKHLDKAKNKGKESMIFITEGQSAAGTLVSCRDAHTQAIFTLKGKPLNVCEQKRDVLYKNVELYNLMRALDIEDAPDRLRYQHVILATDADVDGLHIRNLMITYFLRFFGSLVEDGHLYILETPLFKVRNKKETIYCYSEEERDEATTKLGRSNEITRFKGLGEISPHEFKDFIGPNMKLTPVYIQGDQIAEVLTFYMGKNTQERRTYIMDNLITDEALS